MTQESVLLTGATGNVGAITLEHLINANHKVNAVIRKASAVTFFKSKFPDAINSGLLTFTVVPELTASGVFDEPSASATAIIHVATPLAGPGSDLVKDMIEPTWTIDKNILEAAKKSKTVKRVIICGSIVQTARLPDFYNPNNRISEENFNPITFEEAQNDPASAYLFAKTEAEHKTWSWIKTNQADFDVVMLLPALIVGRSPQPGYKPVENSLGGLSAVYTALLAGKDVQGVDSAFPFVL
ncbi:NAD(P)-binding protein [Plenodomus tracheiphilus IPT5]|uniref:NAD(P)-binding protein n=1 Tax=Plenodomus tracheiphilus IPT5 TaxID=1408161 RepID=A0A6A7AVZ1_9PLEO|nr:NAD(P)-binding protein [Plenodomus tracheiphilus IPT5]